MRYDLVIVGGGLVGAGLAIALARSSLSIALIESRLPSANDPRLLALNSTSCQFLENIGIWPALTAHATPIHQVHVSNQGHFGAVRLNREDVQLPSLGHVVPAYHIEAAMQAALAELPSVDVYCPASLQSLTQQADAASLMIETAQGQLTLSAPIVIGADGTLSTVRSQTSIETEIIDYQQSALVTQTTLKRSHGHIAYERFTQQGAIAMLPLGENRCATIWTADNNTINSLKALSPELFLQSLQTEFGYRLGQLLATGERHVFPLRLVRAKTCVDQHVFLIGNAAHTMHPIAAQGFNLAIYEVAALVDGINERVKSQQPLTMDVLQSISQQVEKQQAVSIGVSHRLPQVFSSQSVLLGMARQLGMIGLDVVSPIKRTFVERMMGKSGRVPSLLLRDKYEINDR